MYKALKKIRTNQSGFTLVELLVVVVILGLLASITMVNLGGKVKQAQKVKAETDIKIIESALELYKIDNDEYPNSIGELVGDYLKEEPRDPWENNYQLTDNKSRVQIPDEVQEIDQDNKDS